MSTPFNEHWLEMGACVSVDIETTAILLGEIKQLRHDAWLEKQWVGLTNEEVELYWDWEDFQCGCGPSTLFAMVRDIEARLKDRNI